MIHGWRYLVGLMLVNAYRELEDRVRATSARRRAERDMIRDTVSRLPNQFSDAELERALPAVMAHAPQCVFYLAGADPYEDDQLGGLRLTRDGLRQRDRAVIDTVRHAGVPLVITLAGGYARRVEDTVAIHAATVEEAVRQV